MARTTPPTPPFIHPLALGVRAPSRGGGQVLLLDGSRKRPVCVRSLPRSAPRPLVFCVSCGRRGHYALTDRHAYFRHANGELECTAGALESARHQRAKAVLRDGIAKTREANAPLVWTRRCDRCGADTHTPILDAQSWSSERTETAYDCSAGAFTFDVGVSDHERLVLALEVRHTHAVDARKLDAASADGLSLLEIRVEDLVDDAGDPAWTGVAPMPPAFVFRVGDTRCPHRCRSCVERGDAASASLSTLTDAFVERVRTLGLAFAVSCVRCRGRVVVDLWAPGARVTCSEDGVETCVRGLDVPGLGDVRVEAVRESKRGASGAHVVVDAETLVAACRVKGKPVLPEAVVHAAPSVDARWVCRRCRCVSEPARELERLLAWKRSVRDAVAAALGVEGASLARGVVAALDCDPQKFEGDPVLRAIALRGVADSLLASPLTILATHLAMPMIAEGWTSAADLLDAPHRRLARELGEGLAPSLELADVQRVAALLGPHDLGWAAAACVAWILAELARDGHTAVVGDSTSLERRARALSPSTAYQDSFVEAACARGVVVRTRSERGESLALRAHADREQRLAEHLARLVRAKPGRARPNPASATLTAEQRESLALAQRLRLSVVTGAAGTGKTHVLRAFVESLPEESWVALAPTGKAACRLREALAGRIPPDRVGTIHRFLASRSSFVPTAFLVDEASMLDVETAARLFDRLVKRSAPTPRVVLVGDTNQLASVGAGAVLRDVLSAVDAGGGPVVPRVELRVVQRSTSTLATFARDFLAGQAGLGSVETSPCDDEVTAVRAAERAIAHGLASDPSRVQILSPTNVGVRAIDREVQRRLERTSSRLGRFRDGQKVLCTRNRYETPRAMNGEVGVLRIVRPTAQLPWAEIDFGGGDVRAPFTSLDLEDFVSAYALTIHKSQGSEWPTVILAIESSMGWIARELAYTAITRAKSHLVIVGAVEVLFGAARGSTERVTSLAERIGACVDARSPPIDGELRSADRGVGVCAARRRVPSRAGRRPLG